MACWLAQLVGTLDARLGAAEDVARLGDLADGGARSLDLAGLVDHHAGVLHAVLGVAAQLGRARIAPHADDAQPVVVLGVVGERGAGGHRVDDHDVLRLTRVLAFDRHGDVAVWMAPGRSDTREDV